MRVSRLPVLSFLRHRLALGMLLLTASLLTGCGFQLRGVYTLPYDSLYLDLPDHSVIGVGLKRAIRTSSTTRLVPTANEAQAIFRPAGERRDREILSVSGTGRISEMRLYYRYHYRVTDTQGRDLIPPGRIEMIRDMTYDDSNILAKQHNEDLLWLDMEKDLVDQLVRRLAAVKPKPPSADE
ncbi:MAG TPA: LPS assembly lipoprotein LptE [Accumulibacter sp.]|nr:LPS assembly lipoprotein LptE [Accumulibacter sp.]HMW18783.1 LPS assembly lipoprotein LptE [Accumulibacter sp.]HMX22483.1 LPS assembly lipoprotein LptE [Accumulibacter sp.]HNC18966.1 LPS assembly lipoprotein LptE [Accumulibacter sp.]HND80557.1 LPS assembly lipoprotein LptE [Accumulibacter sp.]